MIIPLVAMLLCMMRPPLPESVPNTYRLRAGDHYLVTKTWISSTTTAGKSDTIRQRIDCVVDPVDSTGAMRLVLRDLEDSTERLLPIPIDRGIVALTVKPNGRVTATSYVKESVPVKSRREALGRPLDSTKILNSGIFILSYILPVRNGPGLLSTGTTWKEQQKPSTDPRKVTPPPIVWSASLKATTSYTVTSTVTERQGPFTAVIKRIYTFDKQTGAPVSCIARRMEKDAKGTIVSQLEDSVTWQRLP